jgi:hypothetical protein
MHAHAQPQDRGAGEDEPEATRKDERREENGNRRQPDIGPIGTFNSRQS